MVEDPTAGAPAAGFGQQQHHDNQISCRGPLAQFLAQNQEVDDDLDCGVVQAVQGSWADAIPTQSTARRERHEGPPELTH